MIEGLGRRLQRILIVLCLSTLCLGRSGSGDPHTAWPGVPQELDALLHRNVSELPPFPEDPSALRDVRRWPKRRTFDGEPYELLVEAWDDAGHQVVSADEIRPGSRYSAKYVRWNADRRVTRGPVTFWGPDGTVYEQGYFDADRNEVRGYGPSGWLMQYRDSRPRPKTNWLSCAKSERIRIDEWFDEAGNLIGFRATGFGRNELYYWAGARRTYGEYIRLMQDWHPWKPAVLNEPGTSSSPIPSPPPRSRRGT